MKLRGGGCGSIKGNDTQTPSQIQVIIPPGLATQIKIHSQRIAKKAVTVLDEESNLMNSFQFFQLNARFIWQLAKSQSYNAQAITLVFESLDTLLKVLPSFIQSNIQYAYFLSQLISLLTWVVFTFYTTNTERQLDLPIYQKYLADLENIKQTLEVECESNIYLSHIEFELFIIQSVIQTTPTNSQEGKEILFQFLGGALKAALTFSLNDQLIESLKRGVVFIYQEDVKYSLFKKLEIIYSLNDFKYSILDQIEHNVTAFEIATRMEKIFNDIIKESNDWEIWHSWIQLVSFVFQSKPIVGKLNLDKELRSEIEEKEFLYENFDKNHFLCVKYQNFLNDKLAKQVLDNSKILQELIILQQILLAGRGTLSSYEQQYFFKLKIQQDSGTQEKLVISPTKISQLLSLIRQIQNSQNQIVEALKKQELGDSQKIKVAEKLIKDYQSMAVLIIFELSHLEQLQSLISQDRTPEQEKFEEYDQILLLSVQVYLNGLINNQSQQYYDLFPKQKYQVMIDKIEKNSNNSSKFKQIFLDFQNTQKPKIDQIKNLLETIKKLTFHSQTTKVYSKSNSLSGLDLAIQLVKECKPILTWNLQTSVTLQINLKMIQLEKQDLNNSQLINNIPQINEKMISYDSIEHSVKFLYQQYNSCITQNLLENVTQSQSKIDKLLHTLIIDKINSINLVNQILVQNLFKNLSQEADLNFDLEILKMIKEQLESTIQYVTQVQSALKMIFDFINDENEANNEEKSSQETLLSKSCFEELQGCFLLNEKQMHYQFEKNFQLVSTYQTNFDKAFQQLESQIKEYDEQIYTMLLKKQKCVQNLVELLLAFLKIHITSDQDKTIQATLKEDIKIILDQILQLDFQKIDSSLSNSSQTSKIVPEFFIEINDGLEDIRLNQEDQLRKAIFLEDKTNNLMKQIENLNTLKQVSQQFEKYLPLLEESKLTIKNVLLEFKNQAISISIDVEKIQKHLEKNKVDLKKRKEIESQVYFVLCQIDSKEEKLNFIEEKIDSIKENILDFLDRNKWRVRQAIIFELLQMRHFSLGLNVYNQSSGLLVKFQIFETDKRIRMLFENQKGQELSQLMSKSWQSQEQQIQNKLKEKMKELNDISKQIMVEAQPQMKNKLKKEYTALEKEIQGILENIENISNQLGITVLFFQDMKQDLLRIESKINSIAETVDNINKDIQFLKGRSVKEMLEIRMQKVLSQRLIHNSDNVYIQISTKEKIIEDNREDIESVLFTEDIFGNGEINEFIWKQQKDSLLIHGQAGSGKSTAARKIEEFLWLIYQKNKGQTDYVPLIPIFVSLPQLKDPVYCAIEETLKSDNYRFTDRQIDELKDEVEQKKFRLIIILDSYDELKQQYIGLNLNSSNRISKWRASNDKNKYPKVITTSRSELFTINGYSTWFLSEASQNKFYKEVRLLKFSTDQVREYIKEYTFLCMKRVIKEFYFQFYQEQNYQDFENFYQEILKSLKLSQNQQSSNQMLNDEQITSLITKCQAFISPEDQKTMQQMLIELWPKTKYEEFIKIMQLESVIETPFMVEIVMAVLPYIVKQRQELNNIKENFIRKFVYLSKGDESIQKQALDEWQNIVNNQQFINEFKFEFQVIEQEKKILQYLKNNQKLSIIKKALIQEPLSAYDFYVQFFEHYFKRQIHKLRESGEQIDFDQIGNELWEFSHKLANEMTFRNMSQVPFQPSGLVFKKEEEDWRDLFFNDDGQKGIYRRLFRKCIPIKQKGGIYSFNHKSLQEFLVAKWFFEMFSTVQIDKDEDRQISQEKIQKDKDKILKSKFAEQSWDFDYMNGPIRFIIDKVKFNEEFKEKLLKLIYQSSKEPSSKDKNFITASSNSLFLLNLMGQQFIELNFQKIKIKGISLNNANFFGCDFSYTEFENVKFQGVNLNHAQITGANWKQISIDELPKLETKMKFIDQILYYRNKEIIFVIDGEQLKQYNIYNLKEEKQFSIDISKPRACTVSKSQKILALINGNDILLFDLEQNKPIQKLTYGDCFQQSKDAICFTPDDQFLLLGGNDGADQLSIQIKYEAPQQKQKNQSKKARIVSKAKGKMSRMMDNDDEEERNEQGGDNDDFEQKENMKIVQQKDQILTYIQFQSISEENVMNLKCAKFILMSGNYSFTIYYPKEVEEKRLKRIDYQFKKLICTDINKESTVIATGNDSGDIHIYYLSQLDQPIGLSGHRDHVSQVQFASNGQQLVSCSWDKTIILWNVSQQSQLFQTNFQLQNRIRSLCLIDDISANNEALLTFTGFSDGLIQLWDLDGVQSKPPTNKGHQNFISCAIFTFDGEYIISGSHDKSIKIWSTTTGQQVGQDLIKHQNPIQSLAVSDDSHLLCSGSIDGYIYLWDFKNQTYKNQITLFGAQVIDIKIIKDLNNENRIISLTNEYLAQLWSVNLNDSYVLYDYDDENDRKIPQLESKEILNRTKNQQADIGQGINLTHNFLQNQKITAIETSLDNQTTIVGTDQGFILLQKWDYQTLRVDSQDKKPIKTIKTINQKYFLALKEYTVYIYRFQDVSQKEYFSIQNNTEVMELKIFGDLMINCSYYIEVWNLQQKSKLLKSIQAPQQTLSISFCQTNNVIFGGLQNGNILIIDFATESQKQIEPAHDGAIKKIEYLQKSNQLISCDEYTIKIWVQEQTQGDQSLKVFNSFKQSKLINLDNPLIDFFFHPQEFYFILQQQNQLSIWDGENFDLVDNLIRIDKGNKVATLFKKQQVMWSVNEQVLIQPVMNKKVKYSYLQKKRNHFPEALAVTENYIITADYKGSLILWDYDGKHTQKTLLQQKRELKSISLSGDQTKIILSFKNLIQIVQLEGLKIEHFKDMLEVDIIQCCILDQNSIILASNTKNQQLQIISTNSNEIKTKNEHIGDIKGISANNQEQTFLTYGSDKAIRFYVKLDKDYSCKFTFSSDQRFECSGAKIKDFKITSKSKIDLTELFRQKQAILE